MAKLNWEKLAKQQRADRRGTSYVNEKLPRGWKPENKSDISRATRNKALAMIQANKNKNLTR